MEKKVRKFVRSVPPQQLQAFLERYDLVLPEDFSWRGKGHDYANALVNAILEKDDSHLVDIIVRIHDMHEEIGQTALCALFGDHEDFEQQKGEMGRSLWAFCHSEKHFLEAEQFAYLDAKRNTRQWSGFNGPKGKTVDTEAGARAVFKEVLAKHFKTKRRFKLEFLRRMRSNQEGQSVDLIQMMIFQEGDEKGFHTLDKDGDNIETTYIRPLEEIALTYEPATGVIEIVSPKKDTRSVLAKAFMKAFLGYDIDDPKNVPLREYNLDILKTPQNLMDQVEAIDNIEDVRVTLMRLKPYDEKNFVTVEVAYQDVQQRSVYDLSREWFSQNDPIKKPFSVKQVRIAVKFKGDNRFANGKLVNVMVSYPNGCNLHEHTEQERLICSKYLKRWGLVTTL